MSSRPPLRSVTSRHNPIVSRFRQAAGSPRADEVLIEGAVLALEALEAGWTLTVVAFAPSELESSAGRALLDALDRRIDRLTVSSSVLAAISPAVTPSGVVALAQPPAVAPDAFAAPDPLVLVAADVQDPGNLGALARSAEAAGAGGLLVAGSSADPFGWKAIRGSMGSVFRLPVVRARELMHLLADVRTRGIRVAALTVRDGHDVYETDLRGPLALLVGGEGVGLPPDVAAGADVRLTIPMAPPVESLNVAVAAAVVLYEAVRQRRR